ncbi:MAG: WGR domain-containing protein [Thalassobius sp.]|nr:WGR domain-containing protein [Thalassovita sp.]
MRLERVNPDRNEYRFYEIEIQPTLFSDYSLMISWGRIGHRGRQRIAMSGSFDEIFGHALGLEARKMRRGYLPARRQK